MKNKIYLGIFAIALSMLATPGQAQECADSTTLTLLVSKYQLNLIDKAPVCITPTKTGFAIRVVIAGNIEVKNVTVGQKVPEKPEEPEKLFKPVEITGVYDKSSRNLTVTVSGNEIEAGEVFYYLINVEGVGILDPKIRVIPD
jgi:hypothetical protein